MQNSEMTSGQLITLKLEKPAYGGGAISRHKGKIVMVSGHALPGETAEVVLQDEKKDYFIASVKKILEPSPDRIQPACEYFGSCGGCHYQHVAYKRQVKLKEEILRDSLRRIGGFETDLSDPLVEKIPWHYRLRGQFKISQGKIGFYREKTRDVVDITSCPLMTEELNSCLTKARTLCRGLNVSEIHLTNGDCSTALLKMSGYPHSKKALQSIASQFMEAGFAGLCIQSKENSIYSFGRQYISLDLAGLSYTVSVLSFFQSHWKLNQQVAEFIRESLLPFNGEKILDLYSGAGNFSIPLAGVAKIIAVEENPYSIEDGKRNLVLNSIGNFKFVRSTAEKFNLRGRFGIVLLDPPRPGLTKAAMNRVMELLPERIVYLSCNPATFARHLNKLPIKYDIVSVRAIDFFPQTFHIESLAFLQLRS